MARIIRVFRVSGYPTENGELSRRRVFEDVIDLEAEESVPASASPSDVAQAVLDRLQAEDCDRNYSSYPHWQPHGWYCGPVYDDPATGLREEKTAHLEGFSAEESRLVHVKLFGVR